VYQIRRIGPCLRKCLLGYSANHNQICVGVNPLQTTWMERGTVSSRVALLLRSAEVKPLFNRFVQQLLNLFSFLLHRFSRVGPEDLCKIGEGLPTSQGGGHQGLHLGEECCHWVSKLCNLVSKLCNLVSNFCNLVSNFVNRVSKFCNRVSNSCNQVSRISCLISVSICILAISLLNFFMTSQYRFHGSILPLSRVLLDSDTVPGAYCFSRSEVTCHISPC